MLIGYSMAPVLSVSSDPAREATVRGTHRLVFLDGLRALAAFFVVFRHMWHEIWPAAGNPDSLWTRWMYTGHISIDLFIVLSGFSLMLPVVRGDGRLRGGALTFWRRRARRILPPYYLALGVSFLLIFCLIGKKSGTLWDYSLPLTWHGVLIHLLLLQNFSARDFFQGNYALWSLSLEWWMYFLFPLLVWAWKKLGAGPTTGLAIAGSYALCAVCHRQFQDSFTLQYVALFALGMLGCEIVCTRRSVLRQMRDRLPWGVMTWITGALAALAMNGEVPHFSAVPRTDALVGLWALCLLVTLGLNPANLIGRTLSRRPFAFVGSFSYSVYLIHAPLIQVFWQYILRPLHLAPLPTLLLLVTIGTPAIFAAAFLFFLGCERPFMNLPGKNAPKTESQAEAAAIFNPAP